MKRKSVLLLTAIFLLASNLPSAAQKFSPKAIQFKGAPEYSDQELLAAAGLKKGAVLAFDEMKDHSQKLMDTGVFDTLNFKFDGTDLVYTLVPSTSLYPVRLENLPLTPGKELDAALHERVPLYHGKVPSEGGMLEGVRGALEEILAAKGLKATVQAMPRPGKGGAVVFSIASPAVLVGEIHLDGKSPALEPQAEEILKKLTGTPYDLEGSPSQIATYVGNYYRDKGYIEASVEAMPQNLAAISDDAIRIPFQVLFTPGIQYKLTAVRLAPDLVVKQADFDRQANIHSGDIADGQRVTQNWEFISRQYHSRGYMRATVQPTPSFDREKGTVSYDVTVVPGPIYAMGTLKIENVSDDLRTLMLAAWKMPAGATFNEGAILGFFAIGDANPALKRVFAAVNCKYVLNPNDDAHTVDVTLRLEKKH
ncbi:MAG: POTRA domain-containing protein [Terracidiphilus sp.]|jgi:outer membrane protein assembly factor BamA